MGFKIKFWGVRGSFPIPRENDSFGGNTSCVEVRTSDDKVVLFDMGTGLKNFGESLEKSKSKINEINIVLSHFHYDHILGFLMFIPLFLGKYTINVYAPANNDNEVNSQILSFLDPQFWPVGIDMMEAKINFRHYSSGSFNISDNIKVTTSPHGHPGGANSLRIDVDRFSVTYVTDCEHPDTHINQNVIDISKGSDILIHDAQFTPEQMSNHKGWGHSSWEQSVAVAKNANVKKLVLFHHNPENGNSMLEKIEHDAKSKFENTISAREGMEIFIPKEVSEKMIS